MTLSIRNPEADALARRLAAMEGREITEAVIVALREAIARRVASETPRETALRLLAKHGVKPKPEAAKPVDPQLYHALDGDI